MHDALNSHSLEVAELLLSSGADWRMENSQGYNCRDILDNHMIKAESLTHESRIMREKVYKLMN